MHFTPLVKHIEKHENETLENTEIHHHPQKGVSVIQILILPTE